MQALREPFALQSGATPLATGAWNVTASYTYFMDRGLVAQLIKLFGKQTVRNKRNAECDANVLLTRWQCAANAPPMHC